MYYIRGMHKKSELHTNLPAPDIGGAFMMFKEHHKDAVVTQITALFTFDVQDEPEPSALVTQ